MSECCQLIDVCSTDWSAYVLMCRADCVIMIFTSVFTCFCRFLHSLHTTSYYIHHTTPTLHHTKSHHRSRVTYSLISDEMTRELGAHVSVPVINHWRLNERHYGGLIGLSKSEAEEQLGRDKVMEWRRSWSVPPPPLEKVPNSPLHDNCSILDEPTIITTTPGKPGGSVRVLKRFEVK